MKDRKKGRKEERKGGRRREDGQMKERGRKEGM